MIRRLIAAVMVVVGTLGVATATSLGTFDDIALSGTTVELDPCTATDVTLIDDTLGGLVNLLTAPITAVSEIDTVRLTGLTGDCDGVTPIVVVGGFDLLAGVEEQVLFVEELSPLPVGTGGTVDVTLADTIDLGDGVAVVLFDLTATNVAFCPAGAACT